MSLSNSASSTATESLTLLPSRASRVLFTGHRGYRVGVTGRASWIRGRGPRRRGRLDLVARDTIGSCVEPPVDAEEPRRWSLLGVMSLLVVAPAGGADGGHPDQPVRPPRLHDQRQRVDLHHRQQPADVPGSGADLRRRPRRHGDRRQLEQQRLPMVNLDADADASDVQLVGLRPPAAGRDRRVLWAGLYWGARRTGDRRDRERPRRSARCRSVRGPGVTRRRTRRSTSTTHVRADGRRQRLPAVRRRHRSWCGPGQRPLLGRQRRRRHGRRPLRRVVARRRLPQPDATAAQPHRLRRLLRHRRQQLRGDPALRLPDPAHGHRQRPHQHHGLRGRSRARPATRRSSTPTAHGDHRCRPARTSSTAPTTSTARSVTTRTPADDNMLGFDIARTGVPGAIPNSATSRDGHRQHHERALLRRLVRHPDRRVRPGLHLEPQVGHQPRRARPRGARRLRSSTRSRTSTPAATPRLNSVATDAIPAGHDATCRARCRSSTARTPAPRPTPSGDDQARGHRPTPSASASAPAPTRRPAARSRPAPRRR